MAALLIPLQIVAGDLQGINTFEQQPAKLAAMEGLWETRREAPAVLFALPDPAAQANRYELTIPGLALTAFPLAHGLIMGALYLPVAATLAGLILRGAAFDFRVKAGDQYKPWWNRAFCAGSLLAALAQGSVSVATPLLSAAIAAKWFALPNLMLLAPVPPYG